MRYEDITFRPIDVWPGELTKHRRRAAFSARWGQTIQLLEGELWNLKAKQVVFQIAVDERDLRLDGKPRAQARSAHPGVILAFDSKFGPLKYVVDTFDRWEDNVRAIALAMEALRKVDRYGVTKRGEQYSGWRAIPAKTGAPEDAISTTADARRFLDEHGGSFVAAAKELHPDNGGDPGLFRAALRARELLGGAA